MSNASSLPEQRLVALLATDANVIVADALGYMAADPFWGERYGARGRRFADEDGHYHLKYLLEALSARSAAPFERYAAWLQRILNTRGMCTRHLDHHFESLSSVLERRAGEDAGPALRILAAGRAALRHDDADAAVVQRVAAQWRAGSSDDGLPYSSAWDPIYLCHYLADGLALSTVDHLVSHIAWTGTALTGRAADAALLRARLRTVEGELRRHDALTPRVREDLEIALAVVVAA